MAVSIPQSFIQELLARVDVVEVVGRYVPLKKGGANFMGLCPFHGEKSPSFSVSPSKQFYHCFGCGKNGNAIGFLMEHAGMGFVEAVQELAQGVGLAVPQDDTPAHQRQQAAAAREKQHTLSEVLERAGAAYCQQLKAAPHAIAYLKQRGVSGIVAKRYGLGYAPEGWRSLASVFPAYDDPLLQESGLVIVGEEDGKRYDRFRDRIMFPIRNVKGECIGFGGRVLGDAKPKYLNSPETPVFHKGQELYGLYEARQAIRDQGYALVTEGYMDVVALAQLGFANAVATLGTACTAEHVHKLFRFTEQVVFSFDGDSAGRRAAHKALLAALPYASDTRSIKFLFLPAEHDPDSFIRAHGPEAFARHVGAALPLSRFVLEAAAEGCDLGQVEGRAHMLSNAQPLWGALPDGALKRQLLAELAQRGQLDSSELWDLWHHSKPTSGARPPAPGNSSAPPWEGDFAPPHAQAGDGGHDSRGSWPAPAGTGAGAYRSKGTWKKRGPWQDAAPPYQGPRPTPVSRADQAARLLLSHMDFLEHLSHEDWAALAQQRAPHGPLFAWLEAQWHEHGAQPWAVLRERLHGQGCEDLALRLMNSPHAQPEGELAEIQRELRGVLDRLLIDHIKQQENEAIHALGTDPQAALRLRTLQAQRKALEAQSAPTP